MSWLIFLFTIFFISQRTYAIPSVITDLIVTTYQQFKLTWTAPENGEGLPCWSYLIKYSTENITTETEFQLSTTFYQSWLPSLPGTTETKIITGFKPHTTYYFSIKASSITATETLWSAISLTGLNFAEAGKYLTLLWQTAELDTTYRIKSADFNNDGFVDFVVANFNQPVKVYKNNGDGIFSLQWSSTETNYARSVAVNDINNDGLLDIAVGNEGGAEGQPSRIYKNNGSFSFSLYYETTFTNDIIYSVQLVDYNNDGLVDLFCANYGGQARFYKNTGSGFTYDFSLTDTEYTYDVEFSDLDNDGDLDLAVGNENQVNRVYRNDNGSFLNLWTSPEADTTSGIACFDMDLDGYSDIISANYNQPVRVYKNNGNLLFTLTWSSTDTPKATDIEIADFTGDGNPDIVIPNFNQRMKLYKNNQDNTFSNIWIGGDLDSTQGLSIADIDNDTDLDLLTANLNQSNKVYKNFDSEFELKNSTPQLPVQYEYNYSDDSVLTLHWGEGNDLETQPAGLYYNVQIGTEITSGKVYNSSTLLKTTFYINLPIETTYYWHVRVIDSGLMKSSWSSVQTASCFIPPGSITNLSALPGYKSIILTWSSPGDNNYTGNITNGAFWIKYTTTSPIITETEFQQATYQIIIPTSTLLGELQSIKITGLTNYTTYFFAIKTRDEIIWNWSAIDTVRPSGMPFNTPPSTFSLVQPLNNSTTGHLKPYFSWEVSVDPDNAGPVTYTIYYSTDENFTVFNSSIGLSGNNFRPLDLLLDKNTYYWYIEAKDIDNGITRSTIWKFYTDNLPLSPFNLIMTSGTVVSGLVKHEWEKSIDPEGGPVTYTIYYSSYSDFSISISSSGLTITSYTVSETLTKKTTWYYKVKAIDEYNIERWSEQIFEFFICDRPPLPFNLVSPLTETVISSYLFMFDWEDTSDPDTGDYVEYELFYSTDSNFNIYNSTAGLSISSFVIAGPLIENAKYFWKVQAYGIAPDIGEKTTTYSNQTWTVWIDTYNQVPDAFNLIQPLNEFSTGYFYLSFQWQEAQDEDPFDSVKYEIRYTTAADYSVYLSSIGLSGTSYIPITPLENKTTYYWKVFAYDSRGGTTTSTQQDWWFYVNNLPSEAFDLISPYGIVITSQPAFVWQETKDPENDPVDYTVYYSTASDFSVYLSSSVTSLTTFSCDTYLLEDVTYYWKVKAESTGENFRWSTSTGVFFVNADDRPPLAFLLLSPTWYTIITSTPINFAWEDTTDPDPIDDVSYELQISSTITFTYSIVISPVDSSSYQFPEYLQEDTTYFWKVKTTGTTALEYFTDGYIWSAVETFRTNYSSSPPIPPELVSPADQLVVYTSSPEFSWEFTYDPDPDGYITDYRVTGYSTKEKTEVVFDSGLLGNTTYWKILTNLLPETTYFWEVSALSNDLFISSSTLWSFSVYDYLAPDPITDLVAYSIETQKIKLIWTATGDNASMGNIINGKWVIYYTTDPTKEYYQLQEGIIEFSTSYIKHSKQTYTISNLLPNVSYYFWIRALDEVPNYSNISNKTTAFSFIDVTPPTLPPDFYAIPNNEERKIKLVWRTPQDPDYLSSLIVYSTKTYPLTIHDGEIIYNSLTERNVNVTWYHEGLTPRTSYYYSLFAYDINFNSSTPRYAQALLWDGIPPSSPIGLKISYSADLKTHFISWKNPLYNSDKSQIDDLEKFNIYYAESYTGNYTFIKSVLANSLTGYTTEVPLTDSPIRYYKITAVDTGTNETPAPLVIDTFGNLMVSASDPSYSRVIIPFNVVEKFYENSNGDSYLPELVRVIIPDEKNAAKIYLFRITDSKKKAIDNFQFSEPVEIILYFEVSNGKIENTDLSENRIKELAIWYHTGLEWVKLPSTVNTFVKNVQTTSAKTGIFKIWRAFSYDSLTLTQVYPTKIFTPNNDGVNDTIEFIVENPNKISPTGEIYKLDGTYIGPLTSDPSGTKFTWDGNNNEGLPCPNGIYVYQISGEGENFTGTVLLAR